MIGSSVISLLCMLLYDPLFITGINKRYLFYYITWTFDPTQPLIIILMVISLTLRIISRHTSIFLSIQLSYIIPWQLRKTFSFGKRNYSLRKKLVQGLSHEIFLEWDPWVDWSTNRLTVKITCDFSDVWYSWDFKLQVPTIIHNSYKGRQGIWLAIWKCRDYVYEIMTVQNTYYTYV